MCDRPAQVRLGAMAANEAHAGFGAAFSVIAAFSLGQSPSRTASPSFGQRHGEEPQAGEQLDLIDLLGERVQTIGGVAVADPRHGAEITTIPRPPNGVEEVPAAPSSRASLRGAYPGPP